MTDKLKALITETDQYDYVKMRNSLARACEVIECYEVALKYYGDTDNWYGIDGYEFNIEDSDGHVCGNTARQALKRAKEIGERE
jgi:hypothetical protein